MIWSKWIVSISIWFNWQWFCCQESIIYYINWGLFWDMTIAIKEIEDDLGYYHRFTFLVFFISQPIENRNSNEKNAFQTYSHFLVNDVILKPNYFKKQHFSSSFLLTWSKYTGPKRPWSSRQASPISNMHETSLPSILWPFWNCIFISGK